MSETKVMDALLDFFDEKKKKQKKKVDDLLQIVTKLERYQKKLEKELSSETKKRKIKQLQSELQVVKQKCAKAHKLLKSL